MEREARSRNRRDAERSNGTRRRPPSSSTDVNFTTTTGERRSSSSNRSRTDGKSSTRSKLSRDGGASGDDVMARFAKTFQQSRNILSASRRKRVVDEEDGGGGGDPNTRQMKEDGDSRKRKSGGGGDDQRRRHSAPSNDSTHLKPPPDQPSQDDYVLASGVDNWAQGRFQNVAIFRDERSLSASEVDASASEGVTPQPTITSRQQHQQQKQQQQQQGTNRGILTSSSDSVIMYPTPRRNRSNRHVRPPTPSVSDTSEMDSSGGGSRTNALRVRQGRPPAQSPEVFVTDASTTTNSLSMSSSSASQRRTTRQASTPKSTLNNTTLENTLPPRTPKVPITNRTPTTARKTMVLDDLSDMSGSVHGDEPVFSFEALPPTTPNPTTPAQPASVNATDSDARMVAEARAAAEELSRHLSTLPPSPTDDVPGTNSADERRPFGVDTNLAPPATSTRFGQENVAFMQPSPPPQPLTQPVFSRPPYNDRPNDKDGPEDVHIENEHHSSPLALDRRRHANNTSPNNQLYESPNPDDQNVANPIHRPRQLLRPDHNDNARVPTNRSLTSRDSTSPANDVTNVTDVADTKVEEDGAPAGGILGVLSRRRKPIIIGVIVLLVVLVVAYFIYQQYRRKRAIGGSSSNSNNNNNARAINANTQTEPQNVSPTSEPSHQTQPSPTNASTTPEWTSTTIPPPTSLGQTGLSAPPFNYLHQQKQQVHTRNHATRHKSPYADEDDDDDESIYTESFQPVHYDDINVSLMSPTSVPPPISNNNMVYEIVDDGGDSEGEAAVESLLSSQVVNNRVPPKTTSDFNAISHNKHKHKHHSATFANTNVAPPPVLTTFAAKRAAIAAVGGNVDEHNSTPTQDHARAADVTIDDTDNLIQSLLSMDTP